MKTNSRMVHISYITAELNDLVQELNTLTNRAKASAETTHDCESMYNYYCGKKDAYLRAQSKVLGVIVKLMDEVYDNEQS